MLCPTLLNTCNIIVIELKKVECGSAKFSGKYFHLFISGNKRASTTSSEDNSSLKFASHLPNNVGSSRYAATPSSGRRTQSILTPQQRSISVASNGATQVSNVTSRQLLEGTVIVTFVGIYALHKCSWKSRSWIMSKI